MAPGFRASRHGLEDHGAADQGLIRCRLVEHIPNVIGRYFHSSPDRGAPPRCVLRDSAVIVTAPRELSTSHFPGARAFRNCSPPRQL